MSTFETTEMQTQSFVETTTIAFQDMGGSEA